MTDPIFFDDNIALENFEFTELEWNGMNHLLSATPLETNDPRASVFQKIDLNDVKDNELFRVDDSSRLSLYIPNISPPKGSNSLEVIDLTTKQKKQKALD